MKLLINENRMYSLIEYLISDGDRKDLEKYRYFWDDYFTGIYVRCNFFSVVFDIKDNHKSFFIIVDSKNYPKLSEEYFNDIERKSKISMCDSLPNVSDPRFDTLSVGKPLYESLTDFIGPEKLWSQSLIDVINNNFNTKIKYFDSNIDNY